MAKGVVVGVICCVTLLPSLSLSLINGLKRQSIDHCQECGPSFGIYYQTLQSLDSLVFDRAVSGDLWQ